MMKGIIGFVTGAIFAASVGLNCIAIGVLYGLAVKSKSEVEKAANNRPTYYYQKHAE